MRTLEFLIGNGSFIAAAYRSDKAVTESSSGPRRAAHELIAVIAVVNKREPAEMQPDDVF